MAALTWARTTPMHQDDGSSQVMTPEVQDGVVIWTGAIVVLDGGKAAPARSAVGLTVLGVARDTVDNRTFPTDLYGHMRRVSVVSGVAQYENSRATDEITGADVGHTCFLVDDRTLARTDGGGKRSPAGTVHEVGHDRRVWVDLGGRPVHAELVRR